MAMSKCTFINLLETTSSEVCYKKQFSSRFSTCVPDFFFILTFLSLFISEAVLEKIILYFLFFEEHKLIEGIIFILSSLSPAIYSLVLHVFFKFKCCTCKIIINTCFCIVLAAIGLDSLCIFCTTLCVEVRKEINQLDFFSTNQVFHIPKNGFSLLKTYCIIYSVLKCIPLLFFTTVLLLEEKQKNKGKVFYLTFFLLIHMAIFSLTMAFTLPLRKNPKIFTTMCGLFLSSLNKFMGSMCACGVTLTTFSAVFLNIGYYAFILQGALTLISMWPIIFIFSSKSFFFVHKIDKIICGILFTIIFTFIYIHPYSGKGKLYYYYFYVLKILADIFCIYMFSEVEDRFITTFFAFETILIGFITLFCLINIIHRFKNLV